MTISAQLDSLRRAVPGCSLVAFGDLDARLVLRASSDRTPPQEQLDELCAQAAGYLSDRAGDKLAEQFSDRAEPRPTEAIVLTPDEVRVFVRSPGPQADVLCCLCESAMDAEGAVLASRRTLAALAGDH